MARRRQTKLLEWSFWFTCCQTGTHHSYVWCNFWIAWAVSFRCAPWLHHTCVVIHSYAWCCSLRWDAASMRRSEEPTRRFDCLQTRSYSDTVTSHMCDVTSSYVPHDWSHITHMTRDSITVNHVAHTNKSHDFNHVAHTKTYDSWQYHWCDFFVSATWLIHILHWMPHSNFISYVRHQACLHVTLVCVTWLNSHMLSSQIPVTWLFVTWPISLFNDMTWQTSLSLCLSFS